MLTQLLSLFSGLIGLSFLLLTLLWPTFRQFLAKLPGWVFLISLIPGLLALLVGISVSTGQPWPTGTRYIEESLWFVLLSLGGVSLSAGGVIAKFQRKGIGWTAGIGGTVLALVGLGLNVLPSVQVSTAGSGFEAAMKQALGSDYESRIPSQFKAGFRTQTFNLLDYFGVNNKVDNYKLTKDVQYRVVGTEKLLLDVYQPVESKENSNNPALVIVHGGGFSDGSKEELTEFNTYMAARGWVVFAIDFRSADTYPFPDGQEDVQCALAFIAKNASKYGANPEQITALGRSAGGTLALTAAYKGEAFPGAQECGPQPRLKAVVAYYPPTDLTRWQKEDSSGLGRNTVENYLRGTPEQKPEEYKMASPVSYLDKKLPPTLLLRTGRDQLDLAVQATLLAEKLHASSNTVVYFEMPWAGHGFDLAGTNMSSQLILYYTERFLAYTVSN